MYLKKANGPRTVMLDDGRILSRADLPPSNTYRWVASRKAVVVDAVVHQLISREEALVRYALSEEELDAWIAASLQHGRDALKATAVQKFR
ncbi:DUF1153 domain-containing protein [Marivita sp. XM-24bin2]|jgi:hypothetical protein|uniref:CtrA inhibitor SciP n=1 Tax=unclassified Marivita TaxID=2632480 RepID=UPI000D7A4B4F|nr:DUF1153 domain-containing protein [Marivita sp. XM-24bin2]MCR9108076.1 DUF1153 domain-containing protein [Paracoccaceae bacterium]PWL36009.1 MAG: DUF1153 domain-containing protein [Marivita sp. XM-24bin2]